MPTLNGKDIMPDDDMTEAKIAIATMQVEIQHLTEAVTELKANSLKMAMQLQEIQTTLSEARGGWKTMMMVGGAAATLGGFISWVLQNFGQK